MVLLKCAESCLHSFQFALIYVFALVSNLILTLTLTLTLILTLVLRSCKHLCCFYSPGQHGRRGPGVANYYDLPSSPRLCPCRGVLENLANARFSEICTGFRLQYVPVCSDLRFAWYSNLILTRFWFWFLVLVFGSGFWFWFLVLILTFG
jgi:hypothetical protein